MQKGHFKKRANNHIKIMLLYFYKDTIQCSDTTEKWIVLKLSVKFNLISNSI